MYWTSSWLTLKAKSQLNGEVKGRGVIIGKIERIRKAKVKQTKKNEVVIWYWEIWLNCWGRKITLLSESHRPRAGFDLKGK